MKQLYKLRVYKVVVAVPVDVEDTDYKVTIERQGIVATFEDHMVGCMSRIGQAILQDVEEER